MLKKRFNIIYLFVLFCIGTAVLQACSSKESGNSLFSVLDSSKTGIAFANRLQPTPEFNLFSYMYYYKGQV
jgi:hypothetical protein